MTSHWCTNSRITW